MFWTRDDAAGAWHPTVDYPPGAPPPPSPSLKAHPKAAPAALPTLSADDPTDAATPTPLPNGHAANGPRTPTPTPLDTEEEGEALANGTAAAVVPGSAARENVPSAGAAVSDTADMPVSVVRGEQMDTGPRRAVGTTCAGVCGAWVELVDVGLNGLLRALACRLRTWMSCCAAAWCWWTWTSRWWRSATECTAGASQVGLGACDRSYAALAHARAGRSFLAACWLHACMRSTITAD